MKPKSDSLGGDFSCYVTVYNDTSYILAWTHEHASYGYWKKEPEGTQPGDSEVTYVLADSTGIDGSGGSAEFQVFNQEVKLTFACPYGSSDNEATYSSQGTASVNIAVYANTTPNFNWGTNPANWGEEGSIPSSGHPLSILYVLTPV